MGVTRTTTVTFGDLADRSILTSAIYAQGLKPGMDRDEIIATIARQRRELSPHVESLLAKFELIGADHKFGMQMMAWRYKEGTELAGQIVIVADGLWTETRTDLDRGQFALGKTREMGIAVAHC